MNADKTVSGSFTSSAPPQRTLTVTPPTGTGGGSITGTGINCPGDCSEAYADGTAVTLSANPAAGSTFAGWTGACSGTGSCALTMNADKTVSGSFTATGGGGGTQLLRPNGDITSQWTVSGGEHRLGRAQRKRRPGLRPRFRSRTSSMPTTLNRVTEVALSTVTLGASTPTAGKAWFYMDTAPGQSRPRRRDLGRRGEGHHHGARREQLRLALDQRASRQTRRRLTTCGSASRSPPPGSGSADVFAAYFELTTT